MVDVFVRYPATSVVDVDAIKLRLAATDQAVRWEKKFFLIRVGNSLFGFSCKSLVFLTKKRQRANFQPWFYNLFILQVIVNKMHRMIQPILINFAIFFCC